MKAETTSAPTMLIEPLVHYVQKHPVCTVLAALAMGYVPGKIF
jgi:hypothetical protein